MKKLVSLLLVLTLTAAMAFPVMAREETTYADTVAWDGQYDVVVVGYGAAGAVAGVTAADAGANVLIVEKAPQSAAGGNSRLCAQVITNISDREEGIAYYSALRGEFTLNSDEDIAFIVDNIMSTDEWLLEMGATNVYRFPNPEYPHQPGSDAIEYTLVNGESPTDMMNAKAWNFLSGLAQARDQKIDIWYESPAVHLIQDPFSKTILGVQVEKEGTLVNIRALNGVVLSCGGFENNPEMIQNYLARPYVFPYGTTYNTGDGIRMALEVGADLWHMGNISGPFMTYHPFPDSDIVWNLSMGLNHTKGNSMINVGPDAKRFDDENGGTCHGHVSYNGVYRQQLAVTPAYSIFDETTRLAGPIHPTYEQDNADAIANGVIIQAETIAELAQKLGLDAAALEQTIADYNQMCADGEDILFGRDPQTMQPIVTAPYYAFSLVPGMINTQGGPKRDHDCQVLNTQGSPIPHLYSAGELGSFFDENYQGGGNMSECIWSGRIAGANAAMEKEALPTLSLERVQSNLVYTIDHQEDAEQVHIDLPAGQYLGEGFGMGGSLVVKVTMDGERIDAVEIVSHGETPGISDKAIAQIPKAIVQSQSPQVDAISGCTMTSNAIMDAVADAMRKA